MEYVRTTATKKINSLRKRIKAVAGGTAASKTISILMNLIDTAQSYPQALLISVVSESFPHLKRGAMRDFLNIMKVQEWYIDERWNRTDSIYTFDSGSRIEFFSVDTPDKVRGPRRDILFINEANNVPFEAFNQLEVRTRKSVWLDWNPTSEFWFYTEVLPNRKEDIDFITLTYKDNEALARSIVQSIESRKANKNWWKVYGLGQLGEAEGRIYTDWAVIDEIPHEARLERYGLDFGYSNDPTAIVALYYYNGGYIVDEIAYQRGMTNRDIADLFVNLPKALIKADSAEPKSIDDIKLYGLNIVAVDKGKDSVNQGIQHVQDQRISLTKQSTNILREYRNYLWESDEREGRLLNVPSPVHNHCMDAIRYGFEHLHEMTIPFKAVRYEPGLGGVQIPVYDVDDDEPVTSYSETGRL